MSSEQIIFFNKNRIDLSFDQVVLTASEGQDFVDFVRNRSLNSGWATTGSADANNTTFIVDMVDSNEVSSIILNGHNFKSYKIEKWDPIGSSFVAFTPAIDETSTDETTSRHVVTDGIFSKFKITIRGTQVVDDDKYLAELIVTQDLGQLEGWPVIQDPVNSRNRKINKMLSGKSDVRENVGSFSTKLKVNILKSDADLAIFESLFLANEGFHVWLCGGDESQFSSVRLGYRKKDLPLMKCSNEYKAGFYAGLYKSGIVSEVDLVEVID